MIKKVLKKSLGFILSNMAPKHYVYPQITTLPPNQLLLGRTALVTGGTSGIGYEIAKSFVNAGATVIITGRNQDRIDAAVNKLKNEISNKQSIYGIILDNQIVSDFKQKFQEALLVTGKTIDILVNNAGVNACNFSDGTEEEYDIVLDTNLKGVFFLSQIVAHYMKDNNISGNILNIASSSSLRPAASAYTLSKWGIRGLTLGMARVLCPYGIVVNGLAPGPTATPMLMKEGVTDNMYFKNNLTGRYALPEEIANMAVILVSNMCRMVIGDIVYMTGGAGIISNQDMNYSFN